MENGKSNFEFSCIYKFWSISLEHFIKHKPLCFKNKILPSVIIWISWLLTIRRRAITHCFFRDLEYMRGNKIKVLKNNEHCIQRTIIRRQKNLYYFFVLCKLKIISINMCSNYITDNQNLGNWLSVTENTC